MSETMSTNEALTPQNLFEMVSDEVFRDGVVDETENKLLNILASFLKIETPAAREILAGSKTRFQTGELGDKAPLDPHGLYCRTVSRVFDDGRLDDAEDTMLRGLRKLFRISDSAHARLVEGFQAQAASEPVVAIPPPAATVRRTFEDLLAQHIAMGIDKQIAFQDRIGRQGTVAPDFESGTISFNGQSYKMQLLGTVTPPAGADGKRTWNWSWSEGELAAKGLLESGEKLRDLGIDEDIYVLSEPRVHLDSMDPTHLALVASGVLGAVAYYSAAAERGDLYVLVMDENFSHIVPDPIFRIQTIFPQVAARFTGNHRKAFTHYLAAYGLESGTRHEVYGCLSGRGIAAMFDESGRLVRPPMAY